MVSNFNTRDRLLSATHSSSGHENDADAVVAAAEVDESAKGIASSGKLSVGNNLFGPIFVSLCIFLLPFFALSPEPALAVQSGGRMGGSFGGASSSRSYAGSRSYSGSVSRSNGGYSRGYSRSNVILSPSPFYR